MAEDSNKGNNNDSDKDDKKITSEEMKNFMKEVREANLKFEANITALSEAINNNKSEVEDNKKKKEEEKKYSPGPMPPSLSNALNDLID